MCFAKNPSVHPDDPGPPLLRSSPSAEILPCTGTAGGFKWETVARKLRRAVETVRKWPLRYAERWQAAIDRAELRRAVDNDAKMDVCLLSSPAPARTTKCGSTPRGRSASNGWASGGSPSKSANRHLPTSRSTSPSCSPNFSRGTPPLNKLNWRDPNAFIQFCFTTPDGRPIRQAGVHREMQSFLGSHAKAPVELPRDHGKSFQICFGACRGTRVGTPACGCGSCAPPGP
jgi:hypothetical protein